MRAVILAGGKGTRLAPYATSFPKPLVPIGDQPILEIIIRQLYRHGIRDIVLSIGYLGELIEAYFYNGHLNLPGLDLQYYRESEPLGTAGSLAMISGLDETFLVMNGDILAALDYNALLEYHHVNQATLTIAMHRKEVRIDLGVLETDPASRLTSYREKPSLGFDVSMGIYIYEPKVIDYIPKGQFLDFPDLVKTLIRDGARVVGFRSDDYWLDIGRREDYELAQQEFKSGSPDFTLS